jgi:hypothetical protein
MSGGIALPFLTSALHRGVVSLTPPPWVGGWVGPGVSLDAEEKRKILHCQELNPGRTACSPSLYQLSCSNSNLLLTLHVCECLCVCVFLIITVSYSFTAEILTPHRPKVISTQDSLNHNSGQI